MSHVAYKINPSGQVIGGGPKPLIGIPAAFVFSNGDVFVDAAQIIPLNPLPSQRLSITLSNQACVIDLFTKHIQIPFVPSGGIPTDPPVYKPIDPLFLNLYQNDVLVLGGALCLDRTLIVQNDYFNFNGDFSFIDTKGTEDPQVSGLGSRWQLCYWPNITQAQPTPVFI